MSKSFVNRITLIGNPAVEQLNTEINNRLIADDETFGEGNNYSVYRVFYGLTSDQAEALNQEDSVKEYYYSNDTQWHPASSGFTIFSSPVELDDLQNHILVLASQIDPKLIVCNQTINHKVNQCAARYVVLNNGKVKVFKASIKIKPPKKLSSKAEEMIAQCREEAKAKAFKKMMKEISWVTEDLYK